MMSAKGSIREVDEDIASDKECELNENEEDLDWNEKKIWAIQPQIWNS